MRVLWFHTRLRKGLRGSLKNFLILSVTIAAVALAVFWTSAPVPVFCTAGFPVRVPVIDAGHGGPDGGAVSGAGNRESDINLDIARRMDLIFRLYGIPSYMTRREDISLHGPEADTLREKKNSDLKNRVKMVNGLENVVLLSIHQNSFTDSRYKGAQVFFSDNSESKLLAQAVQDSLRACLDRDNERVPARSDAYLIENVNCPAVMVECGFMSNTQEAALLMQNDYRTRVAMGISAAYLHYYGTENPALE